MRGTLAIFTLGAVLAFPSLAFAQSECPDGWFCDQESQDGDSTSDDADNGQPEAEPEATPAKPTPKPLPRPSATDDDETRPGAQRVIIVDRPENEPAPPKKRRRFREWGMNLRLEGVMMDSDGRAKDASMGGIGLSLRYRPIPYFAFDAGFDFIGGTDWAGNDRQERAVLLSGIVFFNPYDKVQVYTIGGIGFSRAHVKGNYETVNADGSVTAGDAFDEHYRYFGAHLGLGLEFRVSRKVALNIDAIGFIRGRTDTLAETQPEFTDPDTGRTTNTSGGGLGRGGITFYW